MSWATSSGSATSCIRLAVEANRTGDPALARALGEESRAHHGDSPWAESQALSLLGDLAFKDGRREEALDLLVQSAAAADQVGSRWLRINALLSAAEYALDDGTASLWSGSQPHRPRGGATASAIASRSPLRSRSWRGPRRLSGNRSCRAGTGARSRTSRRVRHSANGSQRERGDLASPASSRVPEFERGCEEGRAMTFDEAISLALATG